MLNSYDTFINYKFAYYTTTYLFILVDLLFLNQRTTFAF